MDTVEAGVGVGCEVVEVVAGSLLVVGGPDVGVDDDDVAVFEVKIEGLGVV